MKKHAAAASTDPNGLLPFGSQGTKSVNDLNLQLPNCSLSQKPSWASFTRKAFTAPVTRVTSSKSEYPSITGDENRNSLGFTPPIFHRNQYVSPKKSDSIGQAFFSTNQLIDAFIHSSQLAARGAPPQQNDLAKIILELNASQLPQQQSQQSVNRSILHRITPDKLPMTSRSPPLSLPPETVRGFVDDNYSKPQNSLDFSALPPPPPSPSASRSLASPLTVSDYNSAPSAFYNPQFHQPTPTEQQTKNYIDKMRQAPPMPIHKQLYSAALLYMMAERQQQQQQVRGLTPSQIFLPSHSEGLKRPPIGYSKVSLPLGCRNPKSNSYSSQMRSPSHDPYICLEPFYYPWSKTEFSPSSAGSSYSTIDILRQSKQASESVKPANKLLTTSGVFFPVKQQATPPPLSSTPLASPAPPPPPSLAAKSASSIKNQSDAVDHHFQMALRKNRNSGGDIINLEPSVPFVDLTGDRKMAEGCKDSHPLQCHSSMNQMVHHGVSSCSSSSSISSMSLFDRDVNSPGRKPFLLPPPKSENRINSETCQFSLKKRLIQRYQADSTTEMALQFASVKQEKKPDQESSTDRTTPPEKSSLTHPNFMESNNDASGERNLTSINDSSISSVSAHSTVNGSLPGGIPSKDMAKLITNNTTRRHPPVRASKKAPLLCYLKGSSLSPSTASNPSERARRNGGKRRSSLMSVRKRTAVVGDGKWISARVPLRKTTELRFYNSRISSPAATTNTARQTSSCGRATSVRLTNDQTHSEFDFNGQDEDEEPIPLKRKSRGGTKMTSSLRWFGSWKRKSTSASSGSALRVKVPRRPMEEVKTGKRPRHLKLAPNPRQNRTISSSQLRSYVEEEDGEKEEKEDEGLNGNDPDSTIRAEQEEEEREPDESREEESRKEEESQKCHRCGQWVKAVKLGHQVDPFDFQCCEGNRPLELIRKQLPPSPELAILSHRSLCGGELSPQDVEVSGFKAGTPFIQLNSCTELEQLKPTFRCRACREASRASSTTTVEINTNSLTSGNGSSSSSTNVDKNRARRRGFNNRHQASSVATNANSSSSSRGNTKTSTATVSVFCRFWGFRKLYYAQKGVLSVLDFCRTSEADEIDRSLWAMHRQVSPSLNLENAIYCLEQLGAIACRLILSELSILSSSTSSGNTVIRQCCPPPSSAEKILNSPSRHVAWKRPVQGVREMCDVCETTMFNSHWVCTKCGYSVCSACYYAKASSFVKTKDNFDPTGDATSSVASTTHGSGVEEEGVNGLSPAVVELSFEDYSVRQPWSTCSASRRPHDPSKMMLTALLPFGSLHCLWHRLHQIVPHLSCPCVCISTNRLTSTRAITGTGGVSSPSFSTDTSGATSLDLLADLALKSTTSSDGSPEGDAVCADQNDELAASDHRQLNENADFSGVLYLKDGDSIDLKTFQRHWASNQLVVISGCGKHFNSSLWTAKSLSQENALLPTAEPIVLIDCKTNIAVPRHSIRAFWEAFEAHPNNSKRTSTIRESAKVPQHLKIREWPPLDDLAETHPNRYTDFTEHLPMSEYTHREGQFNLAAHLPSFFVRPDLGPRLHIAHDLTSHSKIGTMNLRVDVTDVVNILMHATRSMEQAPSKGGSSQLRGFLRCAGVNLAEIFHADARHTNVSSSRGLPGAVWHIFRPCDTLVLREYLTRIDGPSSSPIYPGASSAATNTASARGDVIHDQRLYLSQEQLNSLKVETDIRPYTVLQFPGDAIFIPAGSVHQVRNLANCISVSSDFISPEHVPQCLELTEEFRRLPRNHPSHEDKLQVKNMIYHTIKDALSTVLMAGTTATPSSTN